MQFNPTEKDNAWKAYQECSFKDHIQLCSVALKNENFTGSGVLCIDSKSVTGILTAKHNLAINSGFKESPVSWDSTGVEKMCHDFLTNLNILYGPLNTISKAPTEKECLKPESSAIEFRSGEDSWDYDLMFIALTGPSKLSEYILCNPKHAINFNPQNKKLKSFYQQKHKDAQVFVIGFGEQYGADGKPKVNAGIFQVRTSKITSNSESVLRAEKDSENYYNTNVLLCSASNQSSTAPGDSGGPVFQILENQLFLVGINLGANFDAETLLPDEPIKNNANTYVALYQVPFLG